MRIMMIGHSTTLIELDGHRLITDPYFGSWGNPAYTRLAPPGLTREAARDVRLVLLSHNHFDHVDRRYLRSLAGNVPVLAPRRTEWLTRWQGAQNVIGLRPWQEFQFASLSITAVPASHVAPTIGFVIHAEGKHIYFAGDTYYRLFMRDIRKRFRPEIALMPVTTFRLPMTMGETQAVRAAQDLAPEIIIPIHLGIQPRVPLMRTGHTPEGFARRLQEAGVATQVVVLKEGESWSG